MGFCSQLRLLLWKNFKLRKRQPFRIIVEILWPLVLFLILAAVKLDRSNLQKHIPECHYDGKAMPSAGPLPFLQSLVCTSNNTCHHNRTQDELPGLVQDFNTSILSEFFNDFELLLSNRSQLSALDNVIEDLVNLADLVSRLQNGSAQCEVKISNLIVNTTELRQLILSQNITLDPDVINEIFNSSLNITELYPVIAGYINPLLPSTLNLSTTDIADQINTLLCTDEQTELLLYIPDSELRTRVLDELCALTPDQMIQLLQDFQAELDMSAVDEITKCVEKSTGKPLNEYEDVALLKLIEDLPALASYQGLLTELNATLQQFSGMGYNMPTSLGNITTDGNVTQFISTLFCGRSEALSMGGNENRVQYEESAEEDVKDDQITEDDEWKTDPVFRYDNTTTEFCNDLFLSFGESQGTRILWRQVKPMIRGKILYTPDTPPVRKILKEANKFFDSINEWYVLANDWLTGYPDYVEYMETNPRIASIRVALDIAHNNVSYFFNNINTLKRLGDDWLEQLLPAYLTNTITGNEFIYAALSASESETNATRDQLLYIIETYQRWFSLDTEGYSWRTSFNYTNELMEQIKQYLECVELDKFEPVASEEEMVKTGLKNMEQGSFWAGLVFEMGDARTPDAVPEFVKYKIRMDMDRVDTTAGFKVLDKYWTPGPRDRPIPDMKYLTYGFAYIQDLVEHGFIRAVNGISGDSEIGILLQQFPYPCYIIDEFNMAISRGLPMFMVLAWIYSVSMMVKSIVYEKEKRLKEVMKVMGLGNAVHWVAWFITCFTMMLISVILLVIVLKGGKVVEHTDATVLLVFLLAFTLSTISLCFMISVFFSKANLAATCAGVFYFTSYLPYSFCIRWEEYMNVHMKVAVSLFNTVGFGFGCSYLSRYEEQGVGVQWSNVAQSPIPEDNYNMLGCIITMLGDALLYGIITWYVETAFPGQYGVPRPWYFFVTKSYWCGATYNMDDTNLRQSGIGMQGNQTDSFEREPSTLPLGVSVKGLRKVYTRGKKVAVEGLNLNFYEGQITSFLGHNGAGKTTTMSILSGLFPPTEGTAYIYGSDIRTDMTKIRQSMGMCPQHNVLFDSLTVEEHIQFYGGLKGMKSSEVQTELEQMVKDVGLPHKKKELSSNLSGGMKRKLSIAIAFVSNSKVVILDEPTAGVDPYARRSIWELLLKYRKGRTIILSTHFMDEADVLGDRVAIISQGKLCCCGTSLFLKSKFGNGYYLTLVKEAKDSAIDVRGPAGDAKGPAVDTVANGRAARSVTDLRIEVESDKASSKDEGFAENSTVSDGSASGGATNGSDDFDEVDMTTFIRKFIPEARMVEHVGSEVTYQLPNDHEHVKNFGLLFQELDSNMASLGVSSYGISDTTLEEVFLKVAEETGVDEELPDESKRERMEQITDRGSLPRPVTRLSFRGRKGFLGLLGKKKEEVDTRSLDERSLVNGEIDNRSLAESEVGAASIAPSTIEGCNGAGQYKVRGSALVRKQFTAILVKRFHYLRRSKLGFVAQIILPAAFICLAQLFAMINPPTPQQPPMEIHPWLLKRGEIGGNLNMFYSNDAEGSNWTRQMEQLLVTDPSVGTRCMDAEIHEIDKYPCNPVAAEERVWTKVSGDVNDTLECSCTTGYQECPPGAYGPEPPRQMLPTTDYLYNMTDRDIVDWILKTHDQFQQTRYGGLSIGERNPLVRVNYTEIDDVIHRLLVAGNGGANTNLTVTVPRVIDDLENIISSMAAKQNAKVWFNNKGYVSMVGYMNVMNNLILRSTAPRGHDVTKYGISLTNHPMNRTRAQLQQYTLEAGWVDVLMAVSVIFALSFIPATFVLFLIEERVTNSKHLQFVSGVQPTVYWIANFTWDMFNYLIACLLCIFIFLAFQNKSYVSPDNAPCLIALLLLYGWAVTPLMYPGCYVFRVSSSAFVILACANVFLGFISTTATFILEAFQDEELDKINDILKKVFLVLPHYCLGRGLIDMTTNQIISDTAAILGEDYFRNPFEWGLVGKNLMCLAIQGLVFFALTLGIQYKFGLKKLPCLKNKPKSGDEQGNFGEDEDVAKERRRVMGGGAQQDVLTIEGLTKVYKKKLGRKNHTAVNNIAVGVRGGECFGLLGVNGAGKTTTFKMLTGDVGVTKGNAHLAGHSVLSNIVEVHQNLGYCPQFDALCPLLTCEEHLRFYSRLRGVPEDDINMVTQWAIQKLGLVQHSKKLSRDLSGGNKRKLSTALALVGNPPVIFLDEPTTGMDPRARRFLWNLISDVIKDGRSVILTSHNMEECEALCNRIAIMVNGTFHCMGSIQHLKCRFGDGYTVILRVEGQNPDLTPLMECMASHFPQAQLKERHHNMLQYQLGGSGSLAQIFGVMETIRKTYNIEDYSVSQTTLDQVFINFAKLQTEIVEDVLEPDADVRFEGLHEGMFGCQAPGRESTA